MKRIHYLLLLGVLFALSLNGYAQDKTKSLTYSYLTTDGIDYRVNTNGSNIEEMVYFKIPKATAALYKGAKIAKLRIATTGSIGSKAYIFVRTDIQKADVATQLLPSDLLMKEDFTNKGWYTIDFATPYTITGDDELCIGWRCELSSEEWALPFAIGEAKDLDPNGSFIATRDYGSTGEWTISNGDTNVSVEAIFEGDNLPQNAMIISSLNVAPYTKVGNKVHVSGVAQNMGAQTIKSFNLNIAPDGDKTISNTVENAELKSLAKYNFSFDLSTEKTGKRSLVGNVDKINSGANEMAAKTNESPFAYVEKGVQRNVLMEVAVDNSQASTIDAYNKMAKSLNELGDKKANVIPMIIHFKDSYAITGTNNMKWFYNNNNNFYTPAMMLNRFTSEGSKTYDSSNKMIDAVSGVFIPDENLTKYIQAALDRDAYMTLNANAKYNPEFKEITVHVEGTPMIDGIAPTNLNEIEIALIEEGATTTINGQEIVQPNVVRAFLSERAYYGDDQVITGKGFNNDYYYTLKDGTDWNTKKLKAIVYLSDYANTAASSNEFDQFQVTQATSCYIDGLSTGINSISNSSNNVSMRGNSLNIAGDFNTATIYSLTGVEMMKIHSATSDLSTLTPGIYCVKIVNKDKVETAKIMVK